MPELEGHLPQFADHEQQRKRCEQGQIEPIDKDKRRLKTAIGQERFVAAYAAR